MGWSEYVAAVAVSLPGLINPVRAAGLIQQGGVAAGAGSAQERIGRLDLTGGLWDQCVTNAM